jgi:hypothetical protein
VTPQQVAESDRSGRVGRATQFHPSPVAWATTYESRTALRSC